MATGDGLRAREAQFSRRVSRLLGLDEARAYIANASVDEPYGKLPTLHVEVVMRLSTEEALRLRYGEDVVIEQIENGGLHVSIPDAGTGA